MTSGAPPKMRILQDIEKLHKELDHAPTQEEYVDPGSIFIARAILLLTEAQVLTAAMTR